MCYPTTQLMDRNVVPAITVFSPGLITRIPQGGSAQE